uniref:Endoplasmic reticulum transmembrane protein n=1 Tax=Glossina brevipalpis TaxID=37001 RepID=A0A1A9X3F8_9MUSC
MSLLWTLIVSFLYAEIVCVVCLVYPVGNPRKWDRFFKSKFLSTISKKAQAYFLIVISALFLLLVDSFLEMRKYSNEEYRNIVDVHVGSKIFQNTRLFRAQRNFYVSGFAIFLMLVIRRLVTLISIQAHYPGYYVKASHEVY